MTICTDHITLYDLIEQPINRSPIVSCSNVELLYSTNVVEIHNTGRVPHATIFTRPVLERDDNHLANQFPVLGIIQILLPVLGVVSLLCGFGWSGWSRTTIIGFRGHCSTFKLHSMAPRTGVGPAAFALTGRRANRYTSEAWWTRGDSNPYLRTVQKWRTPNYATRP